MLWKVSRHGAAVDAPTVRLTQAERDAFDTLSARIGPRHVRIRRAVRTLPELGIWTAAAMLLLGAAWILGWLTTSPLVAVLGALPFLLGMRASLRTLSSAGGVHRVVRCLTKPEGRHDRS